jgi:hypothetical protein
MPRARLQAGFTRRDVQAYLQWEEDAPCTLESADQLPSSVLNLCQATHRIVTLRGALAARLFCLLSSDRRSTPDWAFNCFAAVDTLLERVIPPRGDLHVRAVMGDPADLTTLPPVPTSGTLTRFQLWGSYDVYNDEHEPIESREGVVHEGLIIGGDQAGQPLVFQKNGPLRPHIADWATVQACYRYAQALRLDVVTLPPDTP